MSTARFTVGIDLGTTNSAVASIDTSSSRRTPEALAIPQLVAAGEVGARTLLPSAVYLPGAHELPAGALSLPWGTSDFAVGLFAREQSAKVPGRGVTSAKSWICHPGVDRTASILPWGAPDDVARISPVEASARVLKHLRTAWEAAHPGMSLADQDVVLTVPASFDAGARELTLKAAEAAGLADVTLLEEPLAAFYHWLEGHASSLADALAGVSMLLVVDVGGGTTDFTLIQVRNGDGLRLDRIAVGDHLLLGGDNVDLALARVAEKRLGEGTLDAAGWGALVQSARAAKEALLAPDAPESRSLVVPGRAAKLVGGSRRVEVTRDEVRALALDGFLPMVPRGARPERQGGLRSLGLPYAADAAITRHLAAFVSRHLGPTQAIDAVLFNGGALTPDILKNRLLDVLESWSDARPKVLENKQLDLAVARGAAHFGLVRRGEGVRVGGGSPRSFFLGIRTAEGHQGLCIVPKGLPEGVTAPIEGRTFQLTVNRPVRFELFSSTGRASVKPGQLIAVDDADDLVRLPPIQTVIRSGSSAGEVGVQVEAGTTEIGTLALWCVAGGERFKLEFHLRGEGCDEALYETGALPKRFGEARELIEKFYGKKPSDVDAREVKNLSRALEKVLGERESWPVPLLRELWSVLWAGAQRRRRSADHERQWLMLTGYTLRPGFGAALDDWRVSETFSIFSQGLQFHQERAQWDQWWILWRRVAGGLDEAAQTSIVEVARYWLEPATSGKTRPRPKGPKVEGLEELLRLVVSLERISPALKREIGEWIWTKLDAPASGGAGYWLLGRLGARVPFHGSAHQVVGPDVAGLWTQRILKADWGKSKDAPFAAALLARATGDRARDLDEALRAEVLVRLEQMKASPSWLQMVREPTALAQVEEQRMFGEGLPPGLRLVD